MARNCFRLQDFVGTDYATWYYSLDLHSDNSVKAPKPLCMAFKMQAGAVSRQNPAQIRKIDFCGEDTAMSRPAAVAGRRRKVSTALDAGCTCSHALSFVSRLF
ncbi:MAG: hypothetical protein ACOYD7_07900 [Raoultibacter sp.]